MTTYIEQLGDLEGAVEEAFEFAANQARKLCAKRNDQDIKVGTVFNAIFWELRLARSKSLRARSWLLVGQAIEEHVAEVGFDVVVLQRGGSAQPGPDVIAAPGHVGLFAGRHGADVLVLGGNQQNGVTVARFDETRILGIRRVVL